MEREEGREREDGYIGGEMERERGWIERGVIEGDRGEECREREERESRWV